MELNAELSAVVTGAASGLGAGTARALAAKGVKVGILDVNEELGPRTAAEIPADRSPSLIKWTRAPAARISPTSFL